MSHEEQTPEAGAGPLEAVVMPSPLYGLVVGIKSQKAIIDAHCFGDCGRIILGGVDGGDDLGLLLVCRTPAAECPHMDREMDKPIRDVQGDPIFLRKLKA